MGDSIPLRHTPCIIALLVTAYLTVLVVGLVGNVVVIVVVIKMPRMKTATKYFILNLAIADLLVLIFCLLPNLFSNIYVPWVMGSLMCKAVPYIQGVSVCASVYSLAAISADRLMAVRSPISHQVTKSVALRIVVLIWIWGAGLALPWLLYFDLSNADKSDPSSVFCTENWPSPNYGNVYFVLVNLGLFYLFPLGFITFSHLIIWLRVKRRNGPSNEPVSKRQLVCKKNSASVKTLAIVVVLGFALCWLPLYVIFVRIKLIPAVLGPTEEQVLGYALPVAQWLGSANSCINPILYAFFNRNFRCTLERLVRGSTADVTPKICNNRRQHVHPNQGGGPRPKSWKLRVAFRHRSHRKNSKPTSSPYNATDSGESYEAFSPERTRTLVRIMRSQSYHKAMENPVKLLSSRLV